MKKQISSIAFVLFFTTSLSAQFAGIDNKISFNAGAGMFKAFLQDDGVDYENAVYDPQTNLGFSLFASFDYALSEKLAIGVGYNGNYSTAEYIRDANINDVSISGYLDAGAIENSHFLVKVTYTGAGEGIQPYAKLGLGFFQYEVEMGDVPLELTGGIEEEIFPDFKYAGLGMIPELGIRYNSFTLTAAYSLPFAELEGEDVPEGYISPGSVTSNGLQINFSYRMGLFGN